MKLLIFLILGYFIHGIFTLRLYKLIYYKKLKEIIVIAYIMYTPLLCILYFNNILLNIGTFIFIIPLTLLISNMLVVLKNKLIKKD